jgi:hypothetical protein
MKQSGLESIPGIGPNIARHLHVLGLQSVKDLQGQNPEDLYSRLTALRACHIDRCCFMFFGVPCIMQRTVATLINSSGGTGKMTVKLKFVRREGTGVYAGQNAERNHLLNDKDIVELRFA